MVVTSLLSFSQSVFYHSQNEFQVLSHIWIWTTYYLFVYSLRNHNILDKSNLKAFEDNKIELVRPKMIFFFNGVENIVGKGENAGYQHFLFFPQCLQNALYSGSLKVGTVWERVKEVNLFNWMSNLNNFLSTEKNTRTQKIHKMYYFLFLVKHLDTILSLSQTSPCFYVSAAQVFWKHCGKQRNCS